MSKFKLYSVDKLTRFGNYEEIVSAPSPRHAIREYEAYVGGQCEFSLSRIKPCDKHKAIWQVLRCKRDQDEGYSIDYDKPRYYNLT